MEDIEMAQKTLKKRRRVQDYHDLEGIALKILKKLKINELFNNNLKGLVNDLIETKIASEFDERIWVQSAKENSSSKFGDPFRENDDGIIIIHSTLFRYWRNHRTLSSLVRAVTTCQSIKEKERTASRP